MSGFDAWGAAQWAAVISALAAFATVLATRSAARAAHAAERSVEVHFRPQIVLMFARRGDMIVLRMLNAGGPAQHIDLDADPPLANSRGHVLTEQRDLKHGYPVLLPLESVEFPFDDVWAYFGVQHLIHGRPLDFEIVIRGWAATLDREFIHRQHLSLRPLEPPAPRTKGGLEAVLADLQRWVREGPDATDQEEQADLVDQVEQHAKEAEFGQLDPKDSSSLDRFLGHLGWRTDARYSRDRLVMAERQGGVRKGERIAAAGWDPLTALTRLVGFALEVNGRRLSGAARHVGPTAVAAADGSEEASGDGPDDAPGDIPPGDDPGDDPGETPVK
ncbi:MAG: hypothetical protein M3440_10755 [Chloroflexota bacterium]|nr:hypothetical protein [Chloroflexota bacterium]